MTIDDMAKGSFEHLWMSYCDQKETISDLHDKVERLVEERDAQLDALAEVRDLFPMPEHGNPLEREWASAMADQCSVPDYVRACIAQPKAEPVRPQNCGTGFCSCIECVMDEPTVKDSLTVAEPVQEPFGIWHQADDPDECEFFLWKDSGDVSCPSCIKLYAAPQDGLRKAAQMALEWFEWLHVTESAYNPPHLAMYVQDELRKELA